MSDAIEAARQVVAEERVAGRPLDRRGQRELKIARALLDAVGGRDDNSAPAVAAPLPCDVLLAPATIIRKGCGLDTLMLALKQREGRGAGSTTWPKIPRITDAGPAALASPSTEGWFPMSTAPKDETEIWAYTTDGFQRVVHWEEALPSAPDDPGHDAGWMSEDGATYPSLFYYKPQPPVDPPLRWRPLPEAPDLEQEGHATVHPEPKASTS